MTNKLWSECSKDEHRELDNWHRRLKYWQKKYNEKEIDHRVFLNKLAKLSDQLDELEAKYD